MSTISCHAEIPEQLFTAWILPLLWQIFSKGVSTMRTTVLILSLISALAMASGAAAATVSFDNSPQFFTSSLTGFSTTGSMMDGMSVTVTYSDGSSDTASWADTGSDSGAATVAGMWSLSMSGDTFSNNWTFENFSNLLVSEVFVDAGVGDTVFDVLDNGTNSPGSALGDYSHLYDGTVLYSGSVAIDDTFYGDLYRYMDIELATDLSGGESFSFLSDTDNLEIPGDIQPVPEPATMLLSALGLGGAFFMRRRRS
jgi:hypothetical protein